MKCNPLFSIQRLMLQYSQHSLHHQPDIALFTSGEDLANLTQAYLTWGADPVPYSLLQATQKDESVNCAILSRTSSTFWNIWRLANLRILRRCTYIALRCFIFWWKMSVLGRIYVTLACPMLLLYTLLSILKQILSYDCQ